jgi:hypothetical protein
MGVKMADLRGSAVTRLKVRMADLRRFSRIGRENRAQSFQWLGVPRETLSDLIGGPL